MDDGRRITEVGAQRLYDPAGWEKRVRAALRRTDSRCKAADELGVSERTLYRYLEELGIAAEKPEKRRAAKKTTRGT